MSNNGIRFAESSRSKGQRRFSNIMRTIMLSTLIICVAVVISSWL